MKEDCKHEKMIINKLTGNYHCEKCRMQVMYFDLKTMSVKNKQK